MFDALTQSIDPRTGKPFSFVGNANSFGGVYAPQAGDWTQLDPSVNMNAGDGAPGALGLDFVGYSPEFLQQIGYTGGDPRNYRQGENVGIDPAFTQYLQDQGLTLGRNTRPGENGGIGKIQLGAFDAQGNQRGLSEWVDDPDNQFGAAIAAASLFAGGAAAGLYGGAESGVAAGAGQSAGGIAETGLPEYAANPYNYAGTLTADAGAGLPAGSVAALEGAAGGSGAAADAAGMSLAEGAYPAGITAGSGGFLNGLSSAASSAADWAKTNPTNALGGLANTAIGAYASQVQLLPLTECKSGTGLR